MAHEKEKSENILKHLEQYSALVYSAHFPLSLLSKANEALMKLVSYGFLSSGWNCRILAKHEHTLTFCLVLRGRCIDSTSFAGLGKNGPPLQIFLLLEEELIRFLSSICVAIFTKLARTLQPTTKIVVKIGQKTQKV